MRSQLADEAQVAASHVETNAPNSYSKDFFDEVHTEVHLEPHSQQQRAACLQRKSSDNFSRRRLARADGVKVKLATTANAVEPDISLSIFLFDLSLKIKKS